MGVEKYPYKEIANKLEQLRGNKKKTEFAKMLKIPYNTYLRYETGEREIAEGLLYLAEILVGEMLLPKGGKGEVIILPKLFEAWNFLGQVEGIRREQFQEKQKIELLSFVYNAIIRGEQSGLLDELDKKIKETTVI